MLSILFVASLALVSCSSLLQHPVIFHPMRGGGEDPSRSLISSEENHRYSCPCVAAVDGLKGGVQQLRGTVQDLTEQNNGLCRLTECNEILDVTVKTLAGRNEILEGNVQNLIQNLTGRTEILEGRNKILEGTVKTMAGEFNVFEK